MESGNVYLQIQISLHLTSRDTQTNRSGILGDMYIKCTNNTHIVSVNARTDYSKKDTSTYDTLMSDTDNIVDADTINDANIIGDAASGAILYSMTYSEPIWYEIVTASRSTILDNTDIHPIVSTIDNAYRSHNLGLIYEIKIEGTDGNIIV